MIFNNEQCLNTTQLIMTFRNYLFSELTNVSTWLYRVNYKVVSHLFRLYYSQLFCIFYTIVASICCHIIFSLRNCDSKLMIALQLFYVIPFATKCKPVRKICIFSIMKINVDTFFFLHICPTLDDIFIASKLKWTEVSVYHVITMTHD